MSAGQDWAGANGSENFYKMPYNTDPDFIRDCPKRGTIYKYIRSEGPYLCPSDKPGPATDTVLGGGGNGRLSYSMNAYIAFKSPSQLTSFRYVVAELNRPLPDWDFMQPSQRVRSFQAGDRVVFTSSTLMTMFEEHPFYSINNGYPEGNFGTVDSITTRHSPASSLNRPGSKGRSNIGYLDTHVETGLYPAPTVAPRLFTVFGQPTSDQNLALFMRGR